MLSKHNPKQLRNKFCEMQPEAYPDTNPACIIQHLTSKQETLTFRYITASTILERLLDQRFDPI